MTWLDSPRELLSWFYSYPWEFMWWINQVLSIEENWVSILAVVLIVCMILYIINHED
jgi:membrane protein insertase Oxa1/YidC/SpoIIIJ